MIPSYFSKGAGTANSDKDSAAMAPPVTQAEKIAASAFQSPTRIAARFRPRSPIRSSQASVASGGTRHSARPNSRPSSPTRRTAHPDRGSVAGSKVFQEISGVTSVQMKRRPASPSSQGRQSVGQTATQDSASSAHGRDTNVETPGVRPAMSALSGAESFDPLADSLQTALSPSLMGLVDQGLNKASDYIHKSVERVDSAMGSFLPNTPAMMMSDSTIADTATMENGDSSTLGTRDTRGTMDTKQSYPGLPSRGQGSMLRNSTTRTSGGTLNQSVFSKSTKKSNYSASASARSSQVSTGGGSKASKTSKNSRSASGAQRGSLDFINNDNTFFVVTDLILSRFKKEILSKSQAMMLSDSDRAHLDRTVPVLARDKFVEAVRHRLSIARKSGDVTPVLKQCCALGLDRDKDDDNILYARVNTLIAINQSSDEESEDDQTEIETVKDEAVIKNDDTFELTTINERVPPPAPEQGRERKPPPKVPEVLALQRRVPTPEPEPNPNDSENIARQQLMEELRDASNLMAESVTPEAAKFWRKQVAELQARLREMNGESIDNGPILRTCTSDSMSVVTAQTESVVEPPEPIEEEHVNLFAPRNKPKPQVVPVPSSSASAVSEVSSKRTSVFPPTSKENALVPDTSVLKSGSISVAGSKTAPVSAPVPVSTPATVSAATPPPPVATTTVSNSSADAEDNQYKPPELERSPSNQSRDSMFRSPLQRSPLMAHDKSERLLYKKQELAKSASEDPSLDGLPIVDVVAPADLPGGYTFEAEIEGRRFLATVPFGGVREGETFCCFMRDLETVNPSTIPIGRWRDSILSCFKHGYFHATILLAVVCPLLALGQIMTRMELNFIGLPLGNRKGPTTWTILTRIVGFWALLNILVIGSFQAKLVIGLGISHPDLLALLLINFVMYAFAVYATANTRKTLRTAFHINEKHCFDFEDLFFSTFLLPLAICQMARHTASFEEYDAVCFNSNGLPDEVKVFKRKPYGEVDPPVVNGKLV